MSEILAGQILRAAYVNDTVAAATARFPFGRLAHLFSSSDRLSANADTDFLIGSVAFATVAGRQIKTTWAGRISSSDAGDTIIVKVIDREAATQVCSTEATIDSTGGDAPGSLLGYTTPGAGTHNYDLYARRPFGTGSGGVRSGDTLMIEDIGPV